MWKHTSHGVVLDLMVDGFGVKYTNRKDVEHLINVLQILYPGTTDWTVSKIGDHPEVELNK